MKFYKLLLGGIALFGGYVIVDINSPIQIDYIPGLGYIWEEQNLSPGDTIAPGGSGLVVVDKNNGTFYYYDKNGKKVPVDGRSLRKYEFYVVNNYRWKDKRLIDSAISSFNRSTNILDSVRKYSAAYERFFLLGKGDISKDYEYKDGGEFVGSQDYDDSRERIDEWEIKIKEEWNIYDGEIGDSLFYYYDRGYCQLNDKQKVDSILSL